MKKTLSIILIIMMIILSATITYAYILGRSKTPEHIIEVGNAEALTIKFQKVTSQSTLIPVNGIVTSSDETKEILFWLYVTTNEPMTFKIEHDLTPEFSIVDWTPSKIYNTNEYNDIVLIMNEDADITSFTFYLYIVLV